MAADIKIAPCFAAGWHGCHLKSVSEFELKAIRKSCSDPLAIMITFVHNHDCFIVEDNVVRANRYEVWVKDAAQAIRMRNVLVAFPRRYYIGVTKLPVDPYVKTLLKGLNYLCAKSAEGDGVGGYLGKGLISIQEHARTDKILTILALTRP